MIFVPKIKKIKKDLKTVGLSHFATASFVSKARRGLIE
jgi:hypothetical protein